MKAWGLLIVAWTGALLPAAVHAQSAATFGDQFRSALDLPAASATSTARTEPPLGASETPDPAPRTTGGATAPYHDAPDFTEGFVAAGGALLAALTIVLLFGVIAASRHRDSE